MTNTTNRSQIAASDLARINAELEAARDDVALLERLKSANDRVKRLTAEQERAIKERDNAFAADARAADAARFAGLSDVHITETPDGVREHVLRSIFTIHWTKPTWDGYASIPKRHSIGSLSACPQDVLDYLIERCPERIPAKIMALAPQDPQGAFERYFLSLRRGFVVTL